MQAVKGEAPSAAEFLRSAASQPPPQGGPQQPGQGASATGARRTLQQQRPSAAAKAPAAAKPAPSAAAAAAGGGGDQGEHINEGGQLPLALSKTLDYKSCDHILCLTKDMARQLLPPAPHSCSATGAAMVTRHSPLGLDVLLGTYFQSRTWPASCCRRLPTPAVPLFLQLCNPGC